MPNPSFSVVVTVKVPPTPSDEMPVTLIDNGLFLFPQINTCQNANIRSKITQTNVLV